MNNLVRDTLEGLFVFAIGGTLASAIKRLRRGQIKVLLCSTCGRPTSRAYLNCQRCGITHPTGAPQ